MDTDDPAYKLEVNHTPLEETVVYSTSPEGIVTVSPDGIVSPVAAGSSVITATVGTASDTINVEVTQAV